MREAFVIEIDDLSVGIVQRERGGFRFFAAHRDWWGLDGHFFRNVGSAQHAAEQHRAKRHDVVGPPAFGRHLRLQQASP
jgi:hypothetical protein